MLRSEFMDVVRGEVRGMSDEWKAAADRCAALAADEFTSPENQELADAAREKAYRDLCGAQELADRLARRLYSDEPLQ